MVNLSSESYRARVVILGAGRPWKGDKNTFLQTAVEGTRVLDWILGALQPHIGDVHFVCGYRADVVKRLYPSFVYHDNPEWSSVGPAWSLLTALSKVRGPCVVSYGDILFRASICDELMMADADADADADVVVAIDSHWKHRYVGRTTDDLERCEKVYLLDGLVTDRGCETLDSNVAEFIGLVRLSAVACDYLRKLMATLDADILRDLRLSDVLRFCVAKGMEVRSVDVLGDWAELNEGADLARFVLGTKAKTLSRLRPMLRKSFIEDQVVFTSAEWRAHSERLVQEINRKFGPRLVIVRSSHANEDGFEHSEAGKYLSILNVDTASATNLVSSIEKVISSYADGGSMNEVLVQPMIDDVVVSGVALTQTLEFGAPYFVINYTESCSDTDLITSGVSFDHQTLMVSRDVDGSSESIPAVLSGLFPALEEIEDLLSYNALDVEFAIDKDLRVSILQIRPITLNRVESKRVDPQTIYQIRDEAKAYFTFLQKESVTRFGGKTAFGVMPDWNPAEIIGVKPKELAFSLYQFLITQDIWAQQRSEFGYRDLRPYPLMVRFAGQPYIDIRASLTSFVPAPLTESVCTRIVESCMDWLKKNPELHDKIEFDVIPTCFTLDFANWRKHFMKNGKLSRDEIIEWENHLKQITKRSMNRVQDDLISIYALQDRYESLMESKLPPLSKAIALINDAKNFGTLPFAHLARSAFVAMAIVRSAITNNYLCPELLNEFMETIHTVAHDLYDDAYKCSVGTMSWEELVKKYGHLRPGTYDITNLSYKDDAERFLRPLVLESKPKLQDQNTRYQNNYFKKVVEKLTEHGIDCTEESFENFVRVSVEGRELGKFMFTRNVSSALDELITWGKSVGVDVNMLAEMSVDDLMTIESEGSFDARLWLEDRYPRVQETRNQLNAAELPSLIFESEDFEIFRFLNTEPNYIGRKACVGLALKLEECDETEDFSDKIIFIPQADPGYDWLFGRNIKGLVTMYGGVNSHMAIRASEFGVTAAIGVGVSRYRSLVRNTEIEINPIEKLIRIFR